MYMFWNVWGTQFFLQVVKNLQDLHKFQNNYMHRYLLFKSKILMPGDDSCGAKRVEFINDVIESLL